MRCVTIDTQLIAEDIIKILDGHKVFPEFNFLTLVRAMDAMIVCSMVEFDDDTHHKIISEINRLLERLQ